MVLMLHYRVNEGVKITEKGKSVDVVVRRIRIGDAENHGISVMLEVLNGNLSEVIELSQNQRYPNIEGMKCDLFFPIQYPRRVDIVYLEFFAPREVEISQRRMYPV